MHHKLACARSVGLVPCLAIDATRSSSPAREPVVSSWPPFDQVVRAIDWIINVANTTDAGHEGRLGPCDQRLFRADEGSDEYLRIGIQVGILSETIEHEIDEAPDARGQVPTVWVVNE
jgi:hypothetical protein